MKNLRSCNVVTLALMIVTMVGTFANMASAGVGSLAVRETTEFLAKKFGKEVAEEGAENIAKRLTTLSSKYGDDVVCTAVKKVGPRGIRMIEEAGTHGDVVAKLLSKRGTEAVWVVSKPKGLSLFVKYGDDAAEAMIKHGEAAVPVIDQFGKPAADALKVVSKQNGRRIAMMNQSGELAKLGHTDELLGIVNKYGDEGMNFIWKNKGALAVGTALTAFLLNPEPFIKGVESLGEKTVTPITTTFIKSIAVPAACIAGVLLAVFILLKWKPWRRRIATP
ncbi:MAG: hypothetical protein K6C40_10170 [Thermoguttaceae bacterium]|nr:hypothetical protein [Thermoguttaceae bacterium]